LVVAGNDVHRTALCGTRSIVQSQRCVVVVRCATVSVDDVFVVVVIVVGAIVVVIIVVGIVVVARVDAVERRRAGVGATDDHGHR
jgi:hypothetical protein